MVRKRKVLVVDDQEINCQILSNILETDYEVITACDGKQAMEILNNDKEEISAVLLDVIMPVMTGYEVLEEMNRDLYLSKIPVLVTSQSNGDESELKALNLGAGDFVSKPYNAGTLKKRLKNLIDIREAKATIKELQHDMLTGLLNKEAFCHEVTVELRNNPETEYDIVVADVEHFKLINDICGLQEGDKLLKYIAARIEGLPKDNRVCSARAYGDCFFILFRRNKEFLQSLMHENAEELLKYPLDVKIHLKYGIYEITDRSVPVNAMCDRAVLAAKTTKGQYEKEYAYYDDSFREKLFLEQQITDSMETALKEEQFRVYLQPKYDIHTEKLCGAEALVRWIHPTRGFMAPDRFIPVFENNGFITRLDMFVWEKTCEYISEWIHMGHKYVPVSVNVSRKDIYKQGLPEYITRLVKKYGLEPKHLHLEITETAYTEDPDQLIGVVKQLRAAGFSIEMDDFGSGYSSLNMLARLPIDILKLDMKFMQLEEEEENTKGIMNFIIRLAKWMDLYVTAEGVETKEQLELLKGMDCNYAQGYYFEKPMPEDEFYTLLMESDISLKPDMKEELEETHRLTAEKERKPIMLVADDLAVNRIILKEYFHDIFEIVEITNGSEIVMYFANGNTADIIMLDLYMPVMDGFEVLTRLKANKKTRDIPVIVTSQGGSESAYRAMKLGATDFMANPFSMELAYQRVNHVLSEADILKNSQKYVQKLALLEKRSRTDALTGLLNRTELEEEIERYLQNDPEKCGCLIVTDINEFHCFNSERCQHAGDKILIKTANQLKSCFRSGDIVGRTGGDEFCVFIAKRMTQDELVKRMSKICRVLHFSIEGMECSSAVGGCLTPSQGADFKTLYRRAKTAMTYAKQKQSSKLFKAYEESMNELETEE